MAKKRHTGAFVLGSLIGGLAGAALTLWKTPKSGAELRASLSGGGGDTTRAVPSGETAGEERSFSNPVLSFVEKVAAPIPGVELGKLAKDDPSATAAAPVRSSAADARPPESTFDPREPEHGVVMASTDTPGPAGEPIPEPADTTAGPGETVVYHSGTSVSSEEPVGETHAESTEALTSPTLEEERSGETVTAGTAGPADSTERATELAEEGAPGYEAVNPEEEATHDPVEGSEAHAATTEDLTHPTPDYVEELEEERASGPPEDGSADFPEPPTRDETR